VPPALQSCDESYIKYIFQVTLPQSLPPLAPGTHGNTLGTQKSGDHLYSKGDYEGAMLQYVETINYVEPSSVIRKVSTGRAPLDGG
jgi:hypothetical protein